MKKTLLLTSLLTVKAATASTAVFVGGFTFDNIVTNTFDGPDADFNNDASYSLDFAGATSTGEFWANGDFGSTNLGAEGGFFGAGAQIVAVDGNLTSNLDIFGQLTDFPAQGKKLRVLENGAFTVQLDGTGYEQFELFYSAQQNGGAASINWSVSTDGQNFSAVEVDQFSTSDLQYSVDLTGQNIDNGQFFLQGQVGQGGFLDIDSFAFYGAEATTTVVPEPSTYALMMAGIVGMVVYFRRRRA